MNKNIIYIGLGVLFGIGIGYLLFNAENKEHAADHVHEAKQWTCSMHPQVMQPKEGDCPICGMDLIPASSAAADGLAPHQFKMTKNAMALANVQTTTVTDAQQKSNGISLSGSIKANENNTSVQVTHFSGRIEKLYTKVVGDVVKKGQIVAMLYAPELVAAQQELITAKALKKSQPNLYKAVRNKLKLRKLSDQQIEAIESSGKVIERFPIIAESSGIIASKMVEEGDHIQRGEALLQLTNLNSVWVALDAYESQLSFLKLNQELDITTNSYPDQKFTAKINFIDPVLDANTRTVIVRAVLTNKNGLLKPGMFVEAHIKGVYATNSNQIHIPKTAVLWTGKRSLVYVKTDKDKPIFEMREVVLGTDLGEYYEIQKGLETGEEIVTQGTFTVDAAAQLQGKTSMMNKKEKVSYSLAFEQNFIRVIEVYLKLKDALVATDIKSAKKEVGAILIQIESVMNNSSEGDLVNLKDVLQRMKATNDITQLRNDFIALSNQIVDVVEGFSQLDKKYFVQQCPMANENQGAIWLSDNQKIRNPYFGDMMLECGSVINTIQ